MVEAPSSQSPRQESGRECSTTSIRDDGRRVDRTAEPHSRLDRECPRCRNVFPHDTVVCPHHLVPLRLTEVSLPFLWIG